MSGYGRKDLQTIHIDNPNLDSINSSLTENTTVPSGLIKDGSADMSTIINNAITKYQHVRLTKGTYKVSSSVYLPVNTSLYLDNGAIIQSDLGIHCLRVTGDNVTITGGGTIKGNSTKTPDVDKFTVAIVATSGIKNLKVIGINIENFGFGISGTNLKSPVIAYNIFKDFRITSAYLYLDTGSTIEESYEPIFAHNRCVTSIGNYDNGTNGKGVNIQALRPLIIGNYIDGGANIEGNVTTTSGVRDGIWLASCQDFVCVDNITQNCGDDSITVYQCDGGIVSNNECFNSLTTHGIYLKGATDTHVKKVQVLNNKCYNNARNGILVQYADDCTILNNICYSNGDPAVDSISGNGILLEVTDSVKVEGNRCFDNLHRGIYSKTVNDGTQVFDNLKTSLINNTCYKNGLNSTQVRGGILVIGDATKYHSPVFLSNNICYDNGNNGIYINYVDILKIINSLSYGLELTTQKYGLNISYANEIRVNNSEFNNNNIHGININNCNRQTLINTVANDNGGESGVATCSGFYSKGDYIIIRGSEFRKNVYSGVYAIGGYVLEINDTLAEDNGLADDGTGFNLQGSIGGQEFTKLKISGCTIRDNANLQKRGIWANSPTSLVIIDTDIIGHTTTISSTTVAEQINVKTAY